VAHATHGHWAIEDVHNFGPDYDRTLMEWHANIEGAWDDLPNYDERFRRTWRYYLLSSAGSFRVRELQLWQIVFSRTRRRSPVYRSVREGLGSGSRRGRQIGAEGDLRTETRRVVAREGSAATRAR
jgi:hypothetical protein